MGTVSATTTPGKTHTGRSRATARAQTAPEDDGAMSRALPAMTSSTPRTAGTTTVSSESGLTKPARHLLQAPAAVLMEVVTEVVMVVAMEATTMATTTTASTTMATTTMASTIGPCTTTATDPTGPGATSGASLAASSMAAARSISPEWGTSQPLPRMKSNHLLPARVELILDSDFPSCSNL